jgi:hypothetical protein
MNRKIDDIPETVREQMRRMARARWERMTPEERTENAYAVWRKPLENARAAEGMVSVNTRGLPQ